MFLFKLHLLKGIHGNEISSASSINEYLPKFHLAYVDCCHQRINMGLLPPNFITGPLEVDFGGLLSKVGTLNFAALMVEYSSENPQPIMLIIA